MKNFKHKVVTVILARNRSRRLPGKMTQVLANTDITVLDFILDRCKKLDTWPNIIVATSNNKCDDSIERIANRKNIKVYRGSESDVALRFIGAAQEFDFKWAHRLNGDNLVFDYESINSAMKKIHDNIDLISNVDSGHIPGLSVEIVRLSSIQGAYNFMSKSEREHVLPKVYSLTPTERIAWVDNLKDIGLGRLALDTRDDLSNLEGIIKLFKDVRQASQSSVADIIKMSAQ